MVRIHLFILTFLLSTGAAATPMLTTDGSGNVTGATGLEADGATYSMEFVDGSCIELFDGCDSNADFIVPGTGDVTHGALLDTFYDAFIAPIRSSFDPDSLDAAPWLAIGCDDQLVCNTFAPIKVESVVLVTTGRFLNFHSAQDSRDEAPEAVDSNIAGSSSLFPSANYARFSLETVTVPLPGTLPLVALGLLVLGLRRKGKTA